MKSIFRNFGLAFLLAASLSLSCAAFEAPSAASRQKSSAASPQAPASSGSRSAAIAPESSNSNQELTNASGGTAKEARRGEHSARTKDSEDDEAAFKYSPAVRGLARTTGLSLTNAYWLCVVLNFGIIAVLIVLAMKSNVPAMLRARTQEIQKRIEDARVASEDAGRRLRDVEARLARLSSEIEEIQKHAEAQERAEEERIRASIEVEKQKILQAAEQEVTQAANTARRELHKYAVELAVAMAEKGIRLDANTDKLLVEDFTEQLGSDARRDGGS